jgi:hypothetical protein
MARKMRAPLAPTVGQRVAAPIQSEPSQQMRRPVALDAVLLQDRLDITGEVHLRGSLRGQCAAQQERPQNEAQTSHDHG